MEVKVIDIKGQDAGKASVPEGLLDVRPRRDVLHAAVVWQQARRRRWTASTKTRAEVAGGGAKPWRQKGTGRARAGSRRSPLWRGGGTVHGPRPKDVSPKLPKKVRRLALRMAVADRAQNDALMVLRGFAPEQPKTREARDVINAVGAKRVLVVVGQPREQAGVPSAAERAFRNLDGVRVLQPEGLNVYDVLRADAVVVAEEAIDRVWQRLAPVQRGAA
ncbi:MAG: 50S ribosomal protein L4 [Candidatus Dadabacteria bacterium]|nr:MAG: 50S ribosomal protein L4 [Candidatus Dadabacteria bacterium]